MEPLVSLEIWEILVYQEEMDILEELVSEVRLVVVYCSIFKLDQA